jgi:hypothetical protein
MSSQNLDVDKTLICDNNREVIGVILQSGKVDFSKPNAKSIMEMCLRNAAVKILGSSQYIFCQDVNADIITLTAIRVDKYNDMPKQRIHVPVN